MNVFNDIDHILHDVTFYSFQMLSTLILSIDKISQISFETIKISSLKNKIIFKTKFDVFLKQISSNYEIVSVPSIRSNKTLFKNQ